MNEQELVENPQTEEQPVSLRDTLTAAIDEHTEEPASKAPAPVQPAVAPAPKPETVPPTQKVPAQVPGQVTAKQPPAVPEALKPPSQWKPHVREQWAKLPLEVQQEVLRREADSMRLLGSVGPKIRLADEVAGHLQPFAERLQQNGVNPGQFIGDIFETVKSLSYGSQSDKAEVVANIIQAYGVDLRTLDGLLSRRIQMPPEVAQARIMAARAQQVLAQNAQNGNNQQEQQMSVEAEKHLAAFGADPKHEFLDDVRELMADLIESGRASNLEDAYAAAVWANPDTRKILLQREAQDRVTAKSNRAAAARRASASVSGSPNSAVASQAQNPQMSLRQSLEAAFDEHSPL